MEFLASDSSEDEPEGTGEEVAHLKATVTFNTGVSSAPVVPKQHNTLVPGAVYSGELGQVPVAPQQQQQAFFQLTHFASMNSQSLPGTFTDKRLPPSKRRKKDSYKNLGDPVDDGPWAHQRRDLDDDEEGTGFELQELSEAERKQRELDATRQQEAEKIATKSAIQSFSTSVDGQDREQGANESIFYGKEERDYQGRAWTNPPSYIDTSISADELDCYIPKKIVHVYNGGKKNGKNIGVQSIEFFPKYGHLLLSGSMDGTIRVWDTVGNKQCMRSYHGHKEAVRGAHFRQEDGVDFLSYSFDTKIKIWDVETGKCKQTLGNGVVPYSCKYSPTEANVVLAACKNKKIIQYDTRTKEIIQEYDHHFDAVNTLTWYDEGRKFMTCGDDKRVLCWEYGVPTPIKYIAEPDMHTIAAVTAHPNKRYLVGQSLDNKIVVFDSRNKFSMVKKRSFKGHVVAGYACQIGFSPNGQFILSGDGRGQLWFWDFKSGKILRKLKSHKSTPCIGAVWHPVESSTVATCGWDGRICLWQ